MEALIVILAIVLFLTPLAVIYLLFKVGSMSGKLQQAEQLITELNNRISKLEHRLRNIAQTDKPKKEYLYLYDMTGRLVKTIATNGIENVQINIGNLYNGVYYLRLGASKQVEKLVVIH